MTIFLPLFLFVVGVVLGSAANFLVYRQRFFPVAISPWMGEVPAGVVRRWSDRIPLFGWLELRREVPIFGRGFWIRPFLVELLMGIGAMMLYRYEVVLGGLLPSDYPRPFTPSVVTTLHWQFIAHGILIFWMVVASLIDADETIIPDSITLSGTAFGLALAVFQPISFLPDVSMQPNGPQIDFLHLTSPMPPNVWPGWLNAPSPIGWAIGVGCWLLGCFAILPRTWYSRHGVVRAIRWCWARIARETSSRWILLAAVLGTIGITLVWYRGGTSWEGLLTALVGMAVGGGMIWAVRILGAVALNREAMGFGDVTLMAMIGTFVGWQPSIVIFFLAPFVALVIGLIRLVTVQEREIPYGPFLCLATLGVLLAWNAVWDRLWDIFALGILVPIAVGSCLILLPLLLFAWRAVLRFRR